MIGVKNNVNNAFRFGLGDALTGPAERNDVDTIKKHIEVMKDDSVLYRELGKAVLDIAMQKHPDRDYRKLGELYGF